MKIETSQILSGINPETLTLVITGDDLGMGDLQAIARVIRSNPQLQAVTVSHCGLTSENAFVLIEDLGRHPSITEINLSSNNFANPDFMTSILNGNPRINNVSLSDNKQAFSGGAYERFLRAVFEGGHIVDLNVDEDIWINSGAFSTNGKIDRLIQKTPVLLKLKIGLKPSKVDRSVVYSVEEKRKTIGDVIGSNRSIAQDLLSRLELIKGDGDIISTDDVSRLNARLPAVFYLASQQHGRQKTLELLTRFRDIALRSLGMTIDLSAYDGMISAQAHRDTNAYVRNTLLSAELSTIDAVQQAIPDYNVEQLKNNIAGSKTFPTGLRELGADLVVLASKIPVVAIREMTAESTVEPPTRGYGIFAAKVDELGRLIEEISKQVPDQSFGASAQQVGERKSLWQSLKEGVAEILDPLPRSFGDGILIADEASLLLRSFFRDAHQVRETVTRQQQAVDKVCAAHGRVDRQLELVTGIAQQVISQWREEEKSVGDQGANAEAPIIKTPIYIQILEERTRQLASVRRNVQISHGNYIAHAGLIQAQQENYRALVEQSIPLLDEAITSLSRHFSDMNHASGDAGRISPLDVRAARQTVQAVVGIVKEVNRALEAIATNSIEIRGHVSSLLPTGVAPVSAVRADLLSPVQS